MADNPIQFWLSIGNGRERIRLPVNPPSIKLSQGYEFTDVSVVGLGEYTIFGERKPTTFEISSFFPRDYNPSYCEYEGFLTPKQYVALFERWTKEKVPVRLIITNTSFNIAVTLRDFEYESNRGGEPGDIYYTFRAVEYRWAKVKKVEKVQAASARPSEVETPKTYTVKSGDSLWKIAAKSDVLGNGAKWKEIYDLNKSVIGKNPNLIFPGQKLKIPS